MMILTALCVVLCISASFSMQTSQTGGVPTNTNTAGNAQMPVGPQTSQYQMQPYQPSPPQQQQYQPQPQNVNQFSSMYNPQSPQPRYSPMQDPNQRYQPQYPSPPPQQQYDPYNQFRAHQYGQQSYYQWGQQQQQQQPSFNRYGQQSYNPWAQQSYNPWAQQSYNPWDQQSYNPWGQQPRYGNQQQQWGGTQGQGQQPNNFLNYLLFEGNPRDFMMVQSGVPAWMVYDLNPVEAMAFNSISRNQQTGNTGRFMNSRNAGGQAPVNDIFANPLLASAFF